MNIKDINRLKLDGITYTIDFKGFYFFVNLNYGKIESYENLNDSQKNDVLTSYRGELDESLDSYNYLILDDYNVLIKELLWDVHSNSRVKREFLNILSKELKGGDFTEIYETESCFDDSWILVDPTNMIFITVDCERQLTTF